MPQQSRSLSTFATRQMKCCSDIASRQIARPRGRNRCRLSIATYSTAAAAPAQSASTFDGSLRYVDVCTQQYVASLCHRYTYATILRIKQYARTSNSVDYYVRGVGMNNNNAAKPGSGRRGWCGLAKHGLWLLLTCRTQIGDTRTHLACCSRLTGARLAEGSSSPAPLPLLSLSRQLLSGGKESAPCARDTIAVWLAC